MLKFQIKHSGFTLIELLISIGLGIVAVSAILYFYLATVTSSSDTLKKAKLNQEINTLIYLMAQDIRRAGYGGLQEEDASLNKFSSTATKLTVFKNGTAINPVNDDASDPDDLVGECIVYAYDQSLDGDLQSDEQFGYRFSADNETIQILESTSVKSSQNCTDGNWSSVIDDSEVRVTSFEIDLEGSICVNSSEPNDIDNDSNSVADNVEEFDCYAKVPGVNYSIPSASTIILAEIWFINLTIEAELIDDSDISMSISRKLIVRNPHVSTKS